MGRERKEELERRLKELNETDKDIDSDEYINLTMDMLREGAQDLELWVAEKNIHNINMCTHAILTAMQVLRASYKLPPLFFT